MKSARGNFAVAARLIWIFSLFVFVAPRTPAQEDEKAAPEQSSAPKATGSQRSVGRQDAKPTRGNNDARAGAQRGSSSNPPAQSDSRPRAESGKEGGSSMPTRGWRGPASSAPGRSSSSTDTAQNAPEASEGTPAPRVPRNHGPGRSGSSNESAPSAPRPPRNAQAGRGSSAHAPAQAASPTNAGEQTPSSTEKPGRNTPRDGRPERGGSSADRPTRSGAPADASDNAKPPKNGRPNRDSRGSSDQPTSRPGKTANAADRGDSDSGKAGGGRGGFSRTTRANGTVVERDKNGKTRGVTTTRGTTAKLDNRGRVTTIRDRSGNTIRRGPRGERKVETVRADRSRVVSIGRRGGYVERPFDRDGREYMRRTYVIGGISYVHVYRGYHYHGRPYFVYVPPYYYAPAYYGWVFNPWPRPVYFSWGWYGSPWYRPYGYYFAPYPVYPYASLWLTDYLIAENLRLAYEGDQLDSFQRPSANSTGVVLTAYRPAGQANPNQPTVLTPEVKQMIADEVKSVIADQQTGAASASAASSANSGDEVPPSLDPRHRIFVAYSVVEADAGDDTCSLTSSDVIKRVEDTPDHDNTVAVHVLASKNADCTIGSTVRVDLADLVDMENHLREQVDAGLKILSEKQGKDGLPAAPTANPRAVAEGMAAPDPTASADLRSQVKEADQSEKEVEQEAASDSGAAN
jgi:hypothetical protein